MTYFLGINLSHDASAAIVNSSGKVIFAVSEERLSRIKNHSGVPRRSINLLLENFHGPISKVVIGSDFNIDLRKSRSKISQILDSPSSKEGDPYPHPVPGFSLRGRGVQNPRTLVEQAILESSCKLGKKVDFAWINHHDSHLGQALSVSTSDPSLLISLDGHGDGESGAVSLKHQNEITKLLRIKDLDSLGELYSSVTKRYNFKANHHEGKITGLAAFGNYSKAVDVLLKYVSVSSGNVEITNLKGFKKQIVDRTFPSQLRKRFSTSMDCLVSMAEAKSNHYADLAFAVQMVLEESVLEITRYWKSKTNAKSLSLAGGVFANVKLNQRLAEELDFESVRIFPNMGDGGISIGGVWTYLFERGLLENKEEAFDDMFLVPSPINENEELLASINKVNFRKISKSHLPKEIANAISRGKLVGLHIGKMEFGPRALGNRSILIDPRLDDINKIANARLKRTEFMPFAPAVLEEETAAWFDFDRIKDLYPFDYMTMTCHVRSKIQSLIPAVVHIDGTARPQIVKRKKTPLYWEILNEFRNITGIPIVINTSFNVHEEPINYDLNDSISALKRKSVDMIFTESGCLEEL